MKKKMFKVKKGVLTIFAVLLPLLSSAEVIDGIWYSLVPDTRQAEVIQNTYDWYKGEITIPSVVTYKDVEYTVVRIREKAFYSCSQLTSITIPEGVTSIGNSAFYNCSSLASITFSENAQLTSIGENAFCNCNSLVKITIPNRVKSIGNSAFIYCINLASITIPDEVTSIGNSTFKSCRKLTSITCNAATPPIIGGSKTFNEVDKSIPVYVPASSVKAYEAAEYWSEFTNILPLANEYTLKVSGAGYATLYLDYAVAIPEDVKVYIASSVESDRLIMKQVTGVLPANTGVIVRAEEGEYTFVESGETPAEVEGNLLTGTAAKEAITTEQGYTYYVLAKKDGLVAMYRPQLNADGQFVNNANKAYLVLKADNLGIYDDETNTDEEGGQLSNRLRFDFGGTTGIDNSEFRIHNPELIYDLHGRRVKDLTEPGIYVVGGKKVVIK